MTVHPLVQLRLSLLIAFSVFGMRSGFACAFRGQIFQGRREWHEAENW
jgi:hypothetical protein